MIQENTTETSNTCKGLLPLNNDFQAISTCIENHVQTLDENTKKIEKEFNKIKGKIGCNGDFVVGDNILNSLNEIKISNDKIKNVIVGNNITVSRSKKIIIIERVALIFLAYGHLFLWLYFTYILDNSIENITFLRDYNDKVVITISSVFLGFLIAIFFGARNNKLKIIYWVLSIIFIIYIIFGFLFVNLYSNQINALNESKNNSYNISVLRKLENIEKALSGTLLNK